MASAREHFFRLRGLQLESTFHTNDDLSRLFGEDYFEQNGYSASGSQATYSNKKPERSTKRCPWWSTERPNDPLGDRRSAAVSLKRWWRSMASKNGAFLRCQDSNEKTRSFPEIAFPDCRGSSRLSRGIEFQSSQKIKTWGGWVSQFCRHKPGLRGPKPLQNGEPAPHVARGFLYKMGTSNPPMF